MFKLFIELNWIIILNEEDEMKSAEWRRKRINIGFYSKKEGRLLCS